MSDFRLAKGLTKAERTPARFASPKGSNPAAKLGLRYERKVGKELEWHTSRGNFVRLEKNPWFSFYDEAGSATCSPDFLLHLDHGIVVVEVKLKWVPYALLKLEQLYCPVVSVALNKPTRPMIICHYLALGAPAGATSLREAILNPDRPLLWPQNGRMIW